jgi:hypothetical protein
LTALKCDKGGDTDKGYVLQRVSPREIDPKVPLYASYISWLGTSENNVKELRDAGKLIELDGDYASGFLRRNPQTSALNSVWDYPENLL